MNPAGCDDLFPAGTVEYMRGGNGLAWGTALSALQLQCHHWRLECSCTLQGQNIVSAKHPESFLGIFSLTGFSPPVFDYLRSRHLFKPH